MRRFASPMFFIAALLFLAFFLIGLLKTTFRHRQLNQEEKKLERDVTQLDRENRDLLGSLRFLKSDFFLEEEARTKFGLKKPGETVVIVSKSEEQKRMEDDERTDAQESHWRAWWKYFFSR